MGSPRRNDNAVKLDGRGRVIILAISHVLNDIYQGAVPAMLPFFVASRHWDYVAAAGITLAANLLSSVVQPVFGALSDKWRMPWLAPAGLTTAGVGIAVSGLGESYWWTWCAVALSGLGVAAYHPESARLARAAAQGSHVGMSWYSLGGNVGFALGPILVAPILGVAGVTGTPWLIIPALIAGVCLSLLLRHLSVVVTPARRGGELVQRDDWPQFIRLTVVIVSRSITYFALSTFLALWVMQRLSEEQTIGQLALIVLFTMAAVGTLLGGILARRFTRIALIRWAYLLTVPAILGLAIVSGAWMWFFIAAAGLLLHIPFSLQVTLGQDYLPTRIGTASGVTLGLAISVGGLAAPLIGAISNAAGLQVGLLALIAFPAFAFIMTLTLKEPRQVVGAPAENLAPK